MWRDYQERAAELFRSLGCHADIEATVAGARAVHKVDVWVRFGKFGLETRWVIECKRWRAAVPKEKVLALIGVVEDVGADRGVLISAAGFQSGAIKAAEKRNITLTTLNGLRETVREELNSSVAQALETKVIKLKDAFSALSTYEHPRPGYHVSKPRPGVDHHAHGQAYGMLALLELGFERLRLGKPAPFPLPIKTGGRWGKGKTSTAEEFMTKASEAVVILEAMLAEQHRLMRFASG